MIEEANNFILEYQDEKHELKAKFKCLIGGLGDQSASSYSLNDDIDINHCFEVIERELM